MRRAPILAVLVLVAACQTTDVDRQVFNGRAIYVATVKSMTDLAATGVIDLKTAEKFESVRVRVDQLLTAAETALTADKPVDVSTVYGALDALQDVLMLALEVSNGSG